jgi:LysR family transcriptional regulator, nitrogen assimilation regulatory protein
MAFIYDAGPIRGVQFEPMRTEELYLVSAPGGDAGDISIAELADVGLLLPSRIHTIRQVVDAAFRQASLEPKVVGEIESVLTLVSAVSAGVGATVLPWSAAEAILDVRNLSVRRIDPVIEVKLSLCVSDHQPLSEPALAVHDIVHDLILQLGKTHSGA